MTIPALLCLPLLLLLPQEQPAVRDADLAAARALFERNIAAIQERDREAYLACYLASDALVRSGPDGPSHGFEPLAAGTPATGSDAWPDRLDAWDLRLSWIGEGLVHGTYRYRVDFAGDIREGLSERLFRQVREAAGDDDGWRIVVTSAFPSPEGQAPAPIALVGATLHDGLGGEPLTDAVVIVRDGRIEAVGPRASTPLPEGVDVVDLSGRHLAPGLIDTHVHYSQTGWADGRPDARDVTDEYPYPAVQADLEQHPERFHRAFLASGVTAVLDVGGYPWTRRLGDRTETSTTAPHVAAAGALLTTWIPDTLMLPDRQQFVLMEDPDQVRELVLSHAAAGSDVIKVWFIVLSPDGAAESAPLVHAAGAAAAEVGLPLVVHATQLEAARIAVEAGARLLVHSVDDAPVDTAFVDACREAGVLYCPTLTVVDGYVSLYANEVPDAVAAELDWVDPSIAARIRSTPDLPASNRFSPESLAARRERRAETLALMASNLRAMQAGGVTIVAGTDAGNPLTLHGPSVFTELEAMQAAGMSPSAVLVSATSDAARAMGRADDLGAIAEGRIADLIVLEQDPAADIANLRTLTQVMRGGALMTREMLKPR